MVTLCNCYSLPDMDPDTSLPALAIVPPVNATPRFFSFYLSQVIITREITSIIPPLLILHEGTLQPSSPTLQSTDIPLLSTIVLTWQPFNLPILWPMLVTSWRFLSHFFSAAAALLSSNHLASVTLQATPSPDAPQPAQPSLCPTSSASLLTGASGVSRGVDPQLVVAASHAALVSFLVLPGCPPLPVLL